jgi:hypothetical protein
MKLNRRLWLRGVGGAVLGLPFLESLQPRQAEAQEDASSFAIFLRQASGVACAQNTGEIGQEPERFWPRDYGALTPENVEGRALDELTAYLPQLLVVRNCHNQSFDYGDGHANGAIQGLTGRGPMVARAGGDSEASGESIDHRIGRELNPGGRDSLFLYAGGGGWLGGACISHRGPNERRSAIQSPWSAYQTIVGGAGLAPEEATRLASRQKSVNDLVRVQARRLLDGPVLSAADKRRLQLHFDAVRDLEVQLSCRLTEDNEAILEGGSAAHTQTENGYNMLTIVKLHMDVAALAVACGYTRSVAIQVGNGNDGSTRYPDPDTGQRMAENYHYISHRRASHDDTGIIIAGSDLLHHKVDRHFAQMFRHLLDRLSLYQMPSGRSLLDHGVAVWYNDNGNGPGHSNRNIPHVLAGSANGFLKQGQYVQAEGDTGNHTKMLNTIGTAAGIRTASGGYLEDFGAADQPKGVMTELLAS